ncbi:MAG: glycosyltransferase [Butyrivibrio sp.]|nr:glycosyltransferase [Butyrivibrio sp.]
MGMQLLMFTHDYPKDCGDTAFVSTEIDSLCEKFDKVIVFCTSASNGKEINTPNNCVVYYSIPYRKIRRLISTVFSKYFLKNLGYLVEEIKDIKSEKRNISCLKEVLHFFLRACNYSKRIEQIINKEGHPDVIYSFWSDSEVLASIICEKNTPICTRVHGYDLYEERRKSLHQPFKKVVDRRISTVFFISQQGLNYYKRKYATKGNANYILSYLGAKSRNKTYTKYPINNIIRIVSISDVIPLKRVDMIIDALSLLDKDIHVHWTHIGDGPEFDNIKSLANKSLSTKDNISFEFVGNISHENVLDFLESNMFHIFINTSSSEGVPVSMMEALSNSIPIIGNDIGGVREIVDETTGILLPATSTSKEYSEAIVRIAKMSAESYDTLRQGAFIKWNNSFNAEDNNSFFTNELFKMKRV